MLMSNVLLDRFFLALDDEDRVICYDRDVMLPVYQLDSVDQLVLSDQDETAKRTLTVDCDANGNRSIVMRAFMGKFPL